jgi:hypothetical protein
MKNGQNSDTTLQRTRSRTTEHQDAGNGAANGDKDPMAFLLSFYKNLNTLTYYQKGISENLKGTFWFADAWQSWMQPAPTNLWQDILRNWSFSLINFTSQVKGQPELEAKILKDVAGYGSQLGTTMDFLEVLARTGGVDKIKDADDQFKVFKFVDLLDKINRAKGRPEPSGMKSTFGQKQ